MIEDINHRFTSKGISNADKSMPKKFEAVDNLEKRTRARQANDLRDWSRALDIAEKKDNPDRTELMYIYKNMEIDGHVQGILHVLKNKIKAKEFMIIDSEGEEDEDTTKLFESKWFFKYLDWSIEASFYGFSLIELGALTDSQFRDMQLVPREHVIPDLGVIKKGLHRFSTGDPHFNYKEDEALRDWFLFIGDDKDLGLFNNIAPQVISKKHIFSALWQFIEIFGIPMRIGRTDMDDPKQRERMAAMMENMGRASWGVFDLEDSIELKESAKGNVEMFLEAIRIANQEISKNFTGVSGMFEDKSFVGSAEVQERLLKELILSFCRMIMFNITDGLIPAMIKQGATELEGKSFKWKADDLLSTMEKAEVISKLAHAYEFSPETVQEATGLDVESLKVNEPEEGVNVAGRVKDIYAAFELDKNKK